MKFPLDLVYLDRNKKVKKVRGNVGPWRLSACFSAHSILELPVGTIESTQTRAGDQLEFAPQMRQMFDGMSQYRPGSSKIVSSWRYFTRPV